MQIKIVEPILPPESLILVGDIKRCPKNASGYSFLQIGLVNFGPGKHPPVGEIRVKPGLGQTIADHLAFGNVAIFGPDGTGKAVYQGPQITATGALGGDHRIGCWGPIGGPKGGLKVDRHAQFRGLPPNLLQSVSLAVRMPVLRWQSAGAGEQRHDVERFIADRRPMPGRDPLEPRARQIGEWRNWRKEVINMWHFRPFADGLALPDPKPVLGGVNVTNPLPQDTDMPSMTEPKLISGNANKPLARAVARRMTMHRGMTVGLVDARVEQFNDGEIFVEVYENVRGEDMYVIQPTSRPANDNLMELLIIVDALRRSSAARITAVIPYFGYARQDRRSKSRTPITAKLVANMLTEAGVARVLTMDLHAAQIQGFFDIPVDNLYAAPIFALDIAHNFRDRMDQLMVVSPDVGGVARARELAQRINAPLAIVDKRREKAGEVSDMTVIGDVTGKTCILVDDICDTAGTLCKAADELIKMGAVEVHSYITHGVLSGPAVERIQSSVMKSLVITDTIEPTPSVLKAPNIRIVPSAPLFAQAILNTWNGTSISSLLDVETLAPIYEGMYSAA